MEAGKPLLTFKPYKPSDTTISTEISVKTTQNPSHTGMHAIANCLNNILDRLQRYLTPVSVPSSTSTPSPSQSS